MLPVYPPKPPRRSTIAELEQWHEEWENGNPDLIVARTFSKEPTKPNSRHVRQFSYKDLVS